MAKEKAKLYAWYQPYSNPPRIEMTGPPSKWRQPFEPKTATMTTTAQRKPDGSIDFGPAEDLAKGMGRNLEIVPAPARAIERAKEEEARIRAFELPAPTPDVVPDVTPEAAPPALDPELKARLAEELRAAADADPFLEEHLSSELKDALEAKAGPNPTEAEIEAAVERYKNEVANVELEKDLGVGNDPDGPEPDMGLGAVPEGPKPSSSPEGVALTPQEQARIDAFRQYVHDMQSVENKPETKPEAYVHPAARSAVAASPHGIQAAINQAPRARRGRTPSPGNAPSPGKSPSPAKDMARRDLNRRGNK